MAARGKKAARGGKKKTARARKPEPSARRPRVSASIRQAAILVSFIEEAVERGSIHRVNMRAVAERADCTTPAIYRIFGSRAGLLRAAVAWTIGPRGVDLARSIDASAPATERLWELGEAVAGRGLGSRAIFNALIVTELRSDPAMASFVQAALDRNVEMVTGLLEAGVASGEFHADLDCEYVAWRFVALNTFRTHAYLLGTERPEAIDFERRTYTALMRELGAKPRAKEPRPNAMAARPRGPKKARRSR